MCIMVVVVGVVQGLHEYEGTNTLEDDIITPLLKLDISLDFSVRMTIINKCMLFWKQVYYGDNVQQVEFGIWYCYKQFKQKRQKMTRTKLLAP